MLKPNQLNLFDMHGNIWEWVADDIEGINLRAVRGGGFNFVAEGASSAFRLTQKAEVRSEAIGFRLVQEPK
jgi:formylglycine-generating enzyme required for sulfatase activity